MPRAWYNILADAPSPRSRPLHPGTGQPIGPDDLAPLFPMDLIMQEVSAEREIPIPEEVIDVLRLWRPTPLYRAHRLERALGTRSRIYYKYEGVSPAGSHKPEHRRRPGLLQREGRPHLDRDRDRRRPVGQLDGARLWVLRARVQGVHGARLATTRSRTGA